jgi:hypothetical protein
MRELNTDGERKGNFLLAEKMWGEVSLPTTKFSFSKTEACRTSLD